MDPPKNLHSPQVELLTRLLADAKTGKIVNVAVAFTTPEGGASVQATPMSAVTLNHLWRLFDDRVRLAYQEVRNRASASRSPTAGLSVTAKPDAIPREVRRAVEKASRKAAKKAARTAPPAPATN